MFKDKKEFEEALVKAIKNDIKKSQDDWEKPIHAAVAAATASAPKHVKEGGIGQISGGDDPGKHTLEYARNKDAKAHYDKHIVKPLKAAGYHVMHEHNYDGDHARIHISKTP